MLVESIPKEPHSFQVIPFDNPRGQHTLQVFKKFIYVQKISRFIT
jgi:hypothetical protein